MTTRGAPCRWWRGLAAAGLVLATVAAYLNCRDVPFLFDDGPAILRNGTIRRLWPLTDALRPPAIAAGAAGRPLVNLSLALNYAWGGLDVRGYHVTNVALHALAVLALWGVVRRTLYRARVAGVAGMAGLHAARAERVAFFSALLWAVHPLLTESVVCVVQRGEEMGALFYLLTLYGFIRSVAPGLEQATGAAARRRWWQGAAIASCLLGVGSKETVATAPLLVWLYDRTFVAGSFRGAGRARWPFHLALAGTWLPLGVLMASSDHRAGTVGLGLGVSSWDYLVTQCRALTIYLRLSFWPHPLVVDYGMNLVKDLREVWGQALLVLLLFGATVWALIRRPVVGFVGAWFFVLLAPSSSFVPLITQTIAEHRMYLALAAPVIALVWVVHQGMARGGVPVLVLLTLGAGWLTHQRNEVYRDERRLWADVVAREPGNARAHVNLGYYFARLGQWDAAWAENTEAARLLPDYADAHNGIGQALERMGRAPEALAEFALAHWLKPGDPLINFNCGSALARAGRPAEGVTLLEYSLREQPDQPDAQNNLGLALLQLGRTADAMEHFRAGLRLDPRHVELRGNLANSFLQSGHPQEAAAEYERLLRLRPDLGAVHQNLALALMRLDRPAEAVVHAEQALAQLGGSPQLHQQLALALEKCGRIADAIRHDEAALTLDPHFEPARAHLQQLQTR